MSKKENKKELLLKVLYRFWSVVLPLILASGLGIGVFFGLWKTLGLHLGFVIPISVIALAGLIYGCGKMIKLW